MAFVNFNTLTGDNGAIRRLAELLFTTAFKESDLSAVVSIKTGQKNGGKMDWLNMLAAVPVAKKGGNCNPTYASLTLTGAEKSWNFGEYNVPIEICADAFKAAVNDCFKNGILQGELNTGTRQPDITGTRIAEEIILPLVSNALREAMWRIGFFGDKAADHVSGGGVITNGTDLDLIQICDGLFKKAATIITNDSNKLTDFSAVNGAASYAAQKAAAAVSGVATTFIETLLQDADSRIVANGGKLKMTNLMFQALRKDYNAQYHATIPFENVARGVHISEYDGVQIEVLPEWDYCINKYENDGTKWNNPYRVILASRENMFIGTTDENLVPDIELSYDTRTRTNLLFAKSDIDTNYGEDDLVQFGW